MFLAAFDALQRPMLWAVLALGAAAVAAGLFSVRRGGVPLVPVLSVVFGAAAVFTSLPPLFDGLIP